MGCWLFFFFYWGALINISIFHLKRKIKPDIQMRSVHSVPVNGFSDCQFDIFSHFIQFHNVKCYSSAQFILGVALKLGTCLDRGFNIDQFILLQSINFNKSFFSVTSSSDRIWSRDRIRFWIWELDCEFQFSTFEIYLLNFRFF